MFDPLFADVRGTDTRLVFYGSESGTATAIWLATHGPEVETRPLPDGGPSPFVVVESDGRFAGALPLSTLEELLDPPIVRPGEDVSEGYRVLFEALDDTVFRALERRQLLAVSREIEDRAFRTGNGTLRAGFQQYSAFEPQVDVYRELAATDLSVHVYGAPDWDVPEIAGLTYHDLDGDLERYWVLAFDGGDGETPCGLVARERPAGYDGFWTYDDEVVNRVLEVLAEV